jgi:hypothetical protein
MTAKIATNRMAAMASALTGLIPAFGVPQVPSDRLKRWVTGSESRCRLLCVRGGQVGLQRRRHIPRLALDADGLKQPAQAIGGPLV